ncbi:hypothetical protein HMPREF1531_00731 [Propionibacterium sp. oral taxon 192 str. F0372]|uniref:BMC domain-containing protein n=1 Tax=Propionibacterium sp. oral taxon 192 TaxID=671222 RepID=UPI00035427BC|nr:BMC domain-containing protein [Propionibacterium sp. oral taxon 192]EPH06083.1 hypothetical protein HMPREF1531_00731 [Propionibacterium sp. oral taxon 192 str. F0372]
MSDEAPGKQRIIQEFVPGKQVTLAHVIAAPTPDLHRAIGLTSEYSGAIGILTITPSEAAIIAADIASKSSSVKLAFVDRFSGSVVITGELADVESALRSVISGMQQILDFTPALVTRT